MILLGNPFAIKNGIVYWGRHPVPHADAATFQHLGGGWGRDVQHVYLQSKSKKIDITTFQYLNPVFVKDANNAYDWEGAIRGADPKTFETLDPGVFVSEEITTNCWARGYARDSNAVYFHDQMFGRATALRGADPATFVSLRNDFGYDSKSVWCQKSRLPKADPKTWVYLGRLWSMDRERIFYAEREVVGIDRKSFTVVHAPTIGNFSTDCERFFDADRPIDEQEFWKRVFENFSGFENWLQIAYHRIRNTCTTCDGSGDCYCKRKGESDSGPCARCSGSGKCHVCKGLGRIRD